MGKYVKESTLAISNPLSWGGRFIVEATKAPMSLQSSLRLKISKLHEWNWENIHPFYLVNNEAKLQDTH